MKRVILGFMICCCLPLICACSWDNFLFSVPRIDIGKISEVNPLKPFLGHQQKTLDETVTDYLEQQAKKTINGKVFEVHKSYGIEEKDGLIYTYLWSYTIEFLYEGKNLTQGFGESLPLVMVLKKGADGAYIPVKVMKTEHGVYYSTSVKKLFPNEYQAQVLTNTGVQALSEIVKQKALNYYHLSDTAQKNIEIPSSTPSDHEPQATGLMNQKVETSSYSLVIPEMWQYNILSGDTVSFEANHNKYGGINTLIYNPNEPLSAVFPKDTDLIEQKEQKQLPYGAILVWLKHNGPLDAVDENTENYLHLYFFADDKAYDMYFKVSAVSEETVLDIGKTLKLLEKGVSTDNNRKTDSGKYIGQIDGNSIEIRISGIQDEKLAYKAFRLPEDIKLRFEKFEFNGGEEVKFTYDFIESTGQNILVSIEKVISH